MTQINEHFQALWIQIIKHLALSHDTKKMFSFLNKCTIVQIDEDKQLVIIGVANAFALAQIKKFFWDGLLISMRECYNEAYDLDIMVSPGLIGVELKEVIDQEAKGLKSEKAKMDEKDGKTEKAEAVEKVYLKHKNSLGDYFGVLFDTKFQFSNFVVGPNNEFAYIIMQAICQAPGEVHNPFFLHGNVGLGKTHLLQATANQIISTYPDKTVVYLPTSKLVTEIIEGIKANTVNKLLRKFDDVDVLILDDIQIIANKNACQDILLGLFNDFVSKHKQVIFSGDKPPRNLVNIEDRLKTRFALGTLCEITQPDFETRMAILSEKWKARGERLLGSGMELIVATITDNVRELEGITNTLIMKQSIIGRELTILDVEQALQSMGYTIGLSRSSSHIDDIVNNQNPNAKKKNSKQDEFEAMVHKVADYYDIDMEVLLSDKRDKSIVLARSMCMTIAKKQFGMTLEKIGSFFKKNHSSVIYSLKQFEELLTNDESVKSDWRALGN